MGTDDPQDLDPHPGLDLDLAAASLRADASDVRTLLKVLVDYLEGGLGSRLQVQRKGGLFRKAEEIRSLRVEVADDEFEAVVDGNTLLCGIGHSSGGIRIRSQKVDLSTWLTRLLASLQAEAARSQDVRQALENLLIRGRT